MKRYFFSAVVFASLFASQALASPQLRALFTRTFESNYQAAQCFSNVIRLLDMAEKERQNIYSANILHITNKGTSVFGLVNAEYARGRFSPDERNWYFHAVLEKDGMIYDYDYGNKPEVLTVQQYFEKMFFAESKETVRSGKFYVGREGKMKDYEINVLPAVEMLRSRDDRSIPEPKGEKMTLGDYLRRH